MCIMGISGKYNGSGLMCSSAGRQDGVTGRTEWHFGYMCLCICGNGCYEWVQGSVGGLRVVQVHSWMCGLRRCQNRSEQSGILWGLGCLVGELLLYSVYMYAGWLRRSVNKGGQRSNRVAFCWGFNS